jgi:hypothetical protein
MGRRASSLQELQRLLHEGLVLLEEPAMPGILIENECGVRQAVRGR